MISRFIFLREWCRFWWWWWLLFLNKENPTEDVGEVENQLEKKCHQKDDVKMILRFEEQYVEASEVKKGWWWGWRNSYFSKKKNQSFSFDVSLFLSNITWEPRLNLFHTVYAQTTFWEFTLKLWRSDDWDLIENWDKMVRKFNEQVFRKVISFPPHLDSGSQDVEEIQRYSRSHSLHPELIVLMGKWFR